MEPDAMALARPVGDRNDLEGEVLTIPVEVPEGMDLLHIPLRVQLMYPFCYEVIRFLLQFDFLWVIGPRVLASGPCTQSCPGSGCSATETTLLLGILKHYRLHSGLLVITASGRVRFKGRVS